MEFDRKLISNNILLYRKKSRLTQKALSELTGLHSKYISDLERYSGRLPSMESLSKIAEALGISVDNLIYECLSCNADDVQCDKMIENIRKELLSKSIDDLKNIFNIDVCFKNIK